MRKTRNFYCVVFVVLFLEWIRIKNPLNLFGNDYIKEKRSATFKFEVCSKGQEISEENFLVFKSSKNQQKFQHLSASKR